MHTFVCVATVAVFASQLYSSPAANSISLMPLPKEMTLGTGSVAITRTFSVSVDGPGAPDSRVQKAVPRLIARLTRQTAIPIPSIELVTEKDAVLEITVAETGHEGVQKLGDNERYSLTVAENRIKLAADTPLGVLRGMETLLQLVHQTPAAPGVTAGFSVPNIVIQDEPRFPWRGLSFDVSRHFMPVEVVKRELDGLAAVKLNVLHWHLSDDEGFRVESLKFPKLQALGSDGMFYTQDQIRDVLAYAADRGIRVVPEFDIPGHSSSFLAAYPELGSGPGPFHVVHNHEEEPSLVMDPTKESTYEFLDGFIEEMTALFPDEYFHVGGDEVSPKKWIGTPHIKAFMEEHKMANAAALQAYFSKRVLDIVTKHGKHMVGWDEILNKDLPKTAVIQSWRGQQSLWSAAKDGYQGLLSANYYLDLSYPASFHYSIDPMKAPGLPGGAAVSKGPAPGTPADLTPEQAKLILGGEATMWEELCTVEMIDTRLWPRLAAIAERFWSPESTTDVPSMYSRMKVTSDWLQWLGINHQSNAELMRQRLAGPYPVGPLDVLASLVEPTKGYSRHAQKYGIFSTFNRLEFAIPAESDTAREFRNAVAAYLTDTQMEFIATMNGLVAVPGQIHQHVAKKPVDKLARTDASELQRSLAAWEQAAKDVKPMLTNQSVLTENLPVAEGVEMLSQVGQEALKYLSGASKPPADWKKNANAKIEPYVDKRFGDLLIQIAPSVKKLVAAVPGS
jgi:hexosaminidase